MAKLDWFPYSLQTVKGLLINTDNLLKQYSSNRTVKFANPPIVRATLWHYYWHAYCAMYGYVHSRIRHNQNIPEHEREDILHELCHYLVANGKGFFRNTLIILCKNISQKSKFFRIQRMLDYNIGEFYRRYKMVHDAQRVVYEEDLEPQLLDDLKFNPNPEQIAVIKCERETIADMLLKAPDFCRIDKKTYEKYARKFLKSLYYVNDSTKTKVTFSLSYGIKNRFYVEYVMYCIRRIITRYGIGLDDIYNKGLYDAYLDPPFSELLAQRLGIQNSFSTKTKKVKDPNKRRPKWKQIIDADDIRQQQDIEEYQDYERNREGILIPH